MNSLVLLGSLAVGVVSGPSVQAQDEASAILSRGEYVARAANCVACHSMPDEPAFAGGLKMATPIGEIYATNITPDDATGIGTYSLEEFDRAVRLGVAKDGHRLYPAMPYPNYVKITDEDIEALYDYFMNEVAPVNQPNKPSEIPWPLSIRWPLMVWNLFFFDDSRFEPKADQSDSWNRGAYLVQGHGHCGACHTPRGWAFNEFATDESGSDFLAGAFLDNWYASDLTQSNRAGLGRWSREDLVAYLKTGRNVHSTAFGTMDEVIINSTQYLTDEDLGAMADYLLSLPAAHDDGEYVYDSSTYDLLRSSERRSVPGALLFMQQCESCHVDSGEGYPPYMPPMAGNPPLMDPDPASLINIILNGSSRLVVDGTPDAYRMPGYRFTLTDQEIADIVTFIRQGWGNNASAVTAEEVANLRVLTEAAVDRMPVLRMK